MAWKHEDGTLCCCSAPLAASGPATSQVSEERLTEIASAWEHLSQSQRDTGGLYWSEAIQIAGEVLDLRESRRVLVRAFSEFLDRLSSGRLCYYGDSIGYEPQIGTNEIERYRALLIPAQQEAGNASNH